MHPRSEPYGLFGTLRITRELNSKLHPYVACHVPNCKTISRQPGTNVPAPKTIPAYRTLQTISTKAQALSTSCAKIERIPVVGLTRRYASVEFKLFTTVVLSVIGNVMDIKQP